MIDFLRGKLVGLEQDFVVLDVHGVGYRVFAANPFAIKAKESEEVTLFIHHHVREDAILLFGFESREEQALFRRLLEVSGIGPRVAIGILSAGRPEEVVSAIYQENVSFLMKLPGIGKKTAQRMILDLKDKLGELPFGSSDLAASAKQLGATVPARPSLANTPWQEAKEALLALGYTEAEADRVGLGVQRRAGDGASADVLVKLALQEFFKG